MNFENELKQVFDIDIWQLKPQFSQEKFNGIEGLDISDTIEIKATVQTDIDNNFIAHTHTDELVYCNDIISEKVINLFIEESLNINFLKNITEKLFYKSMVNIYIGSSTNSKFTCEKGTLVIHQSDFVSQEYSLLSIENKKYILEKLYPYADFKTY